MHSQRINEFEILERRTLLASIAADLDFANLGEAPVDGQLLLAPVSGGKILAAGTKRVTRLNSDGSIDPSFHDPGLPTADAGMQIVLSAATKTASRVIEAGSEQLIGALNPVSDILFVRALNLSNGHANSTFGQAGIVKLTLHPIVGNRLDSIIVSNVVSTSDGSVFIFVTQAEFDTAAIKNDQTAVIYKLDSSGALDAAFGTNGHVAITTAEVTWQGAAVDAQDRLVGSYQDDNGRFISRIGSDGTFDNNFGTNGTVQLANNNGLAPTYHQVAFQSDGKIILTAERDGDIGFSYDLARLKTDGSFDSSFITNTGNPVQFGDQTILAITIDSQDRIVGVTDDELFRANADGSFDTTFDSDGASMLPRQVGKASITVDASGDPVVGAASHVTRFVSRAQVVLRDDGVLRIDGTEGNDTLQISSDGTNITVDLSGQSQSFPVLQVTSFSIFVGGGNNSVQQSVQLPASIVGGLGNDSISTGDGNETVDSGSGRDTIITEDGDDDIAAQSDATITSGAGDDVIDVAADETLDSQFVKIDSGDGNDQITFEPGTGTPHVMDISAGAGNDHIISGGAGGSAQGGDGNDVIVSEEGTAIAVPDSLYGGGGDDTIHGNRSTDYISGGGGKDHLFGEDGSDLIYGGAGSDTISGGASADRLYGQGGNDVINGNGGNDHLNGGTGNDNLHGNAGNDIFFTNDAEKDSLFGDGGHDSATADGIDKLVSIEAH